ncbi:MAG TPA: DUF4179 domain-containing protein [Candidatus Nitrosotalea sp.]|nr:DUF4179 domain-containing protein [Candidatus Nitrosotalea sp.]
MTDRPLESDLSSQFKRAAAQIAAATRLDLDTARPIDWRHHKTGFGSQRKHVLRRPIGLATVLVGGAVFLSGTAYAGISLLQSVLQSDPGAATVYQHNLGETLNLSQTRRGVTLTLIRAYADVNRVMITYSVSTATGITTNFSGFSTSSSSGQPILTDASGQSLTGYDSWFETNSPTHATVGVIVYDAEMAAQSAKDLSLNVAVSGLNMESTSGVRTVVGPYTFDLTVPVESGQTVPVDQTVTTGDVPVTLDRVVASPSETRVYLRSSAFAAFSPADWYVTAHIIGGGYDTRDFVRTTAGQLTTLGSDFLSPDGEEVVTFNNTLYGKHGNFTLMIDAMGAVRTGQVTSGESDQTRIAGPWVIHFLVP